MTISPYVCPFTKSELEETNNGLVRDDGTCFPYLKTQEPGNPIPLFLNDEALQQSKTQIQQMYHKDNSEEMYDNFLNWLFETFHVSEDEFRSSMIAKLDLKDGSRVLVTGAGLGSDLPFIHSQIGDHGELYAQDLSSVMVAGMQKRVSQKISSGASRSAGNIFLSVGNAESLPFQDDFFDAAFHFGGINFYDNLGTAICEMDRVVRPGGKVVFGDESVAPWLRENEYGKMAICNISNWAAEVPLEYLPETCQEVNLTWILGNCFYIIDYKVSSDLPHMNIDVQHKGSRGGTMRTRYFGQLEGIDPKLKAAVIDAAASQGESVHSWLQKALSSVLSK